MCGIGGIVGGDLRADERESAALRLQGALAHRGPDGAGLFRDGACVLVHTRLAILDPTDAGRQPMRRGPLAVTSNGEIYDFRARREELRRAGSRFDTGTDTEVLLALYAQDDASWLTRLRGMFAFALWDARVASCLLARDPFGIKPLYYATLPGGGLVFASEVRAILATGLVSRRIDPAGLHGFLATGSVPEPHTLVDGIRCLEAGHALRWTAEETTSRSYHEIRFDVTAPDGPPDDLRLALADSVRHHLVSDVPVGLLLSGGLDSSALLALIKAAGHDGIATFSLGVEESALDESAPARALARHFGARHHEMLLTQELARHWIEDFLAAVDQPTLDGFNTYCACKLAASHGCKVVLSGIGADELFGGYPSFRQVPRLAAWGGALRWLPLGAAARTLAGMRPQARTARACDYLGGDAGLTRAYGAFRGVFTQAEIAGLSLALTGESTVLPTAVSPENNALTIPGDEISRLELTRYLRNQLLRDADVMSMVHGVELRVPLLDLPLFARLQAIPAARRLQPNKRLLRDAVPELPARLLTPGKRAFGLPFASWLEHEWSDLSAGLPELPRFALTPWYRRWSLIVLTRWLARHGLHSCTGLGG